MDLAALVGLAVRGSIVLIVVSLGLRATQEDALYLFRRPRQLVRSLLAMNVVMPVVALGLAAAFDLGVPVEAILVALAVSPVPPILPKKQLKAGGRASYAVGLLVVAALLAIVFVPLAVEMLGWAFAREAHVPASTVARVVGITVLLPLAAGIVVRRVAPALAERIAGPVSLGATVLLTVVALLLLVHSWSAAVALIGNGRVLAIAAFVVIGLLAGHLLGGPDPEDRTVLALSTASRHPGVALAIATTTFPDEKLMTGAVLLYLLVSGVVSLPYLKWQRRQAHRVPSSLRGEGMSDTGRW
jgi:BASS family bile acid:Na+ symporter